MDSARPGLPLPLELVVKVVEHCEEYFRPDEEDACGWEERYPDQKLHYALRGPKWMILSRSATNTILTIHQVCRQFRHASIASLATLIGDRSFKFTKAGMRDLRKIANNDTLSPWIKTLTFETVKLLESRCAGTACDRSLHHRHYDITGSGWSYLYTKEITNLDEELQSYQPLEKSIFDQELSQILSKFSNLGNIHFIAPPTRIHWICDLSQEPQSANPAFAADHLHLGPRISGNASSAIYRYQISRPPCWKHSTTQRLFFKT